MAAKTTMFQRGKLNPALVLTACLAFAVTSFAYADTYRWIDANGVVNYSEKKPHGIDAENITTPRDSRRIRLAKRGLTPATAAPVTPTASQSRSAPQSNAQPNLNPTQQDILQGLQANEAQRQQQMAKIRQDNCDRSKRVLANLTAREHIRVRSESGAERVLPEDERQAKISSAHRGIAENCSAT